MKQQGWISAALLAALVLSQSTRADGPMDNLPDNVRWVPPRGIDVPADDVKALQAGLATLAQKIDLLKKRTPPPQRLPDVEIYHWAVSSALKYSEFFAASDIARAKNELQTGIDRAAFLAKGQTPWLEKSGAVALGYVSKIDGSIQPYGVWIPPGWTPTSHTRWRLDTWFHGRDETLSEVNFIDGVSKSGGQFTRPDAFVIQPYGRYCNGSKFAGETDFFEAMDDLKRWARIDENRIVIRGFSLGGASAWHLTAHFAGAWAAGAPGAGFSETAEFLKVFQHENVQANWWEQKLWQLYDAPAYAENFRNTGIVAYSGEIDKQKQAADVMETALMTIGIPMVHVVGPQTPHRYHPDSIVQINRMADKLADKGRDPTPRRVWVTTPTLKYNRQGWVIIDGLAKHWEKALVEAELVNDVEVRVKTKNVAAITLHMPTATAPFPLGLAPTIALDGQKLKGTLPNSDRSWIASFRKAGDKWLPGAFADTELRKRHDLQGPIDDAFMSSFLMVTPDEGNGLNDRVSSWANAEQTRAIKEWRRHFRGEPRVKRASELTDEDVANHNLVLWGRPSNNKVMASVVVKLPIRWTKNNITVGKQSYASDKHGLIAIYPNPLNPKRYVVINSGFTFREYDYLNNARQVPKLPDWAIVDTTTPPDSRWPGKIVDAGFFGEKWELLEARNLGRQPTGPVNGP